MHPLRRPRQLALTAVVASFLIVGCGNPCSDIAETACATTGAETKECARLQNLASRASAEDLRACEVALELVESLEKVQ